MSRKSDNFALVLTGAALALWLLLHKIFDIFFEDWIKHQLEPHLGHTVAEMIEKFGSAGFPALAAGGIVWFLYSYIKSHLRAEAPDPMIEAQRQHTAALIAQAEALMRAQPQNSESAPSDDRNSAIALAGIVNALLERALQYGFKIAAVDPSDPFAQRYQDVKNSIDPIWTDDETNKLRADFLQFCAIVGSDHQDADEFRSDRAELHRFGKRLMAKLKGQPVEPSPADSLDWKSAPEAVELFAESALLAERDKQKGHLEQAMLRRFDAEDKISAILKELPNQKPVEGTEQFKQIEQHNWHVRANASTAPRRRARPRWSPPRPR